MGGGERETRSDSQTLLKMRSLSFLLVPPQHHHPTANAAALSASAHSKLNLPHPAPVRRDAGEEAEMSGEP